MRQYLLQALVLVAPLAAQTPCADGSFQRDDRSGHCEIREHTVADTGQLKVDAATNGGIRVTGADRSNVLIRARVQAQAPTPEEARAMMTQIRIQASPGTLQAAGPGQIPDRSWSVSYEILVPRHSSLDLKAHNGGISISDVEGQMRFDTKNGGVNLKGVGGDVRGKTLNGGLKVELVGNTWRGNQLDVQTTNGGITVTIPEAYSARFETSTVNGGVHADVPGANVVKDRNSRNVSVTLGSGGPLVRLVTTNGGIRLNKS